MKILFCNTLPAECGVHYYGNNLAAVLKTNPELQVTLACFASLDECRQAAELDRPDFILYNWQQMIGGWMAGAPFDGLGKQVFVYHDLDARFDAFHAILFSDPTMTPHGNWHPIGRPLNFVPLPVLAVSERLTVGVNGFLGAWASGAVAAAAAAFPGCHFRLQMPFSTFCDGQGDMARQSATLCAVIASAYGCTLEASHDNLRWPELVAWLARNDLNCYVRPVAMNWRGVSSVLDGAMCAGRPIAINRCNAFRHLHDCRPSICIEDRSLKEILETGIEPLVPYYYEFSPAQVSEEVFRILSRL